MRIIRMMRRECFQGLKKYNNLDYISCWFYLASKYINETTRSGFVTTNSIAQGTQVHDLWPHIISKKIEIGFAVKDFLWTNNARNKAGVVCSIIGLRTRSRAPKYIYSDSTRKVAGNINGYLLDAPDVYIEKRTTPLSKLPKMIQGNIVLDDGNLQLTPTERSEFVSHFPKVEKIIRRIYGSRELINSIERYCLWIEPGCLDLAMSIPPVVDRIEAVRKFRLKGGNKC